MVQIIKNSLVIQETWVQSLGWEDPLEKGMATHSSILAWRIPWTEEPTVHGVTELDTTEQLTHTCELSTVVVFFKHRSRSAK